MRVESGGAYGEPTVAPAEMGDPSGALLLTRSRSPQSCFTRADMRLVPLPKAGRDETWHKLSPASEQFAAKRGQSLKED